MTPRLKISSALMATLIALSSLSGPAFAGGVAMVSPPMAMRQIYSKRACRSIRW